MSEYKVVLRLDLEADEAARQVRWERGCPLMFEAVQVARDKETGEAYLQAKLQNVSAGVVHSFKLEFACKYRDGSAESLPRESLDADLGQLKRIVIHPMKLSRGDIEVVEARVLEVSAESGEWSSSGEAEEVPVRERLCISQSLLCERELLLQERGCTRASQARDYKHLHDDGWDLCACGKISVGFDRCPICGMSFADAASLENEKDLMELAAARAKRSEEEAAARRERRERIKAGVLGVAAKARKHLPLIGVVLVVALVGGCAVSSAVKSSKYGSALDLEESGKYVEALYEFADIPDYKDSSNHLDSLIDMLVMSESELPAEEAVEYLTLYPEGNEALLETCECMLLLEDNEYVQTSKYGTDYLSADYYLDEGEPSADVRYTNYNGLFCSGAEVSLSSDPEYLIEIHAKGVRRWSVDYMDFSIGRKSAYTNFGSGYDFELNGTKSS